MIIFDVSTIRYFLRNKVSDYGFTYDDTWLYSVVSTAMLKLFCIRVYVPEGIALEKPINFCNDELITLLCRYIPYKRVIDSLPRRLGKSNDIYLNFYIEGDMGVIRVSTEG